MSGIDSTVKIFSPDQQAQENARRGVNILNPDNPANVFGASVRQAGGLQSRKRVQDSYRIMSQNDVERRGGISDANITVRIPRLRSPNDANCIIHSREVCWLVLPSRFVVGKALEVVLVV